MRFKKTVGMNAAHELLTKAREILGDESGDDQFTDTTLKTARVTLDGLKRAILQKQVDDSDEMRVTVRLPPELFQKPRQKPPPADE